MATQWRQSVQRSPVFHDSWHHCFPSTCPGSSARHQTRSSNSKVGLAALPQQEEVHSKWPASQHHRSVGQRGQSALPVSALVLLVETGRNTPTKAYEHHVARGRCSLGVHASVLQSVSTEEPQHPLPLQRLGKGVRGGLEGAGFVGF